MLTAAFSALRERGSVAAACAHPVGSGLVQRALHKPSCAAVGVTCLKSVPAPLPLVFLWSISGRLGMPALTASSTAHSLCLS